MTEINVVDVGLYNIKSSTQGERTAAFDEIRGLQALRTWKQYVNAYEQMINEQVSTEQLEARPTIVELLLRSVIVRSTRSGLSTHVLIPAPGGVHGGYTGGAALIRNWRSRAPAGSLVAGTKNVHANNPPGSIVVRFNDRVTAEYVGKRMPLGVLSMQAKAPNEEVIVIGMRLGEYCAHAIPARTTSTYITDTRYDRLISSCLVNTGVDYRLTPLVLAHQAQTLFTAAEEDTIRSLNDYLDYIDSTERLHKRLLYVARGSVDVHMRPLFTTSTTDMTSTTDTTSAVDTVIKPGELMIQAIGRLNTNEHLANIIRFPDTSWTACLQAMHDSSIGTVISRKALKYCYAVQDHGLESEEASAELNAIEHAAINKETHRAFELRAIDSAARVGIMRMLIEKKFGAKRLAAVDSDVISKGLGDMVLSALTDDERRIIELEYSLRNEIIENVLKNKCEHVKALRTFERAIKPDDIKSALDVLRGFFDGAHGAHGAHSTHSGLIRCNKCQLTLICPHLIARAELIIRGASYNEFKSGLSKYLSVGTAQGCRTCGSRLDELDPVRGFEAPTIDDELADSMWRELGTLLRHITIVNKGKHVIDPRDLVTSMRDAIYDEIFEVEKRALKSKTRSADEVKTIKRIMTVVHGMAYLVHLVNRSMSTAGRGSSGPSAASGVFFTTFKESSASRLLPELVKHAIGIIMETRGPMIKRVSSLSFDVIKADFVSAFKRLSADNATRVNSGSTVTVGDVYMRLMEDSIYQWLMWVTRVTSGLKSPAAINERLLGMTPNTRDAVFDALRTSKDIIDNIMIPKHVGAGPKHANGVNKHAGTSTNTSTNTNLVDYVKQSIDLFLWYYREHIYRENIYHNINAGTTTKAVIVLSPKHAEMYKRWSAISVHEHRLKRYHAFACVRPTTFVDTASTASTSTRKFIRRDEVHIGRLYDEQGRPHKWIASTAGSSGSSGAERVCEVCGVKWSDASKIDATKVKQALEHNQAIDVLFAYYAYRCPSTDGGLHDVDDASQQNACKKCGMGKLSQEEYFNKFNAGMLKEREALRAVTAGTTGTTGTTGTVAGTTGTTGTTGTKHKHRLQFDFSALTELAEHTNINPRIIQFMGAIFARNINDILSGKFIPPPPESRYDTRIYVILANIKNFVTAYNGLRWFFRASNPDIAALLSASGIPQHKMTDVVSSLPDIGAHEFWQTFARAQHDRSVKAMSLVDMALGGFCGLALRVWNGDGCAHEMKQQTQKLRQSFVKHIIDRCVRGEELSAVHGYFSWSLLYGDRAGPDAVDGNYVAQGFDDGNDEDEDNQLSTSNPMNDDGFDVEHEETGEGDSNQIRVGENLGLD